MRFAGTTGSEPLVLPAIKRSMQTRCQNLSTSTSRAALSSNTALKYQNHNGAPRLTPLRDEVDFWLASKNKNKGQKPQSTQNIGNLIVAMSPAPYLARNS